MTERWRVGRRNPHNVYLQHGPEPRGMDEVDPDDSLGYFRLVGDAATAVRGVEALGVLAELVAGADDHRCWWIPDEVHGRIRALLGRTTTEEADDGQRQ